MGVKNLWLISHKAFRKRLTRGKDTQKREGAMAARLSKNERMALHKFKNALKETLGENLIELRLFGSKARGEVRKNSDLDVLVIVTGGNWRICDVVYGIATDILLETETCISPKVISRSEYNHLYDMKTPFIKNIIREGIAV